MTYDIIIIGGGPAGLTAAIYAKRANKSVLVIEKATFGGQITYSPKVENIPGFTALSGNEFAEKLVDQALLQGVEMESAEVLSVTGEGPFDVVTDGDTFTAGALIIATGAKHRMLGLADEEKWVGNGISFCAVCDGAFYKDGVVAVIGGGNSALQEALLLSDLCRRVTVVQNLNFLTGEQKLQEQLLKKNNVNVLLGTVADGFIGDETLTGLRVRRMADNATETLSVDGVFVAIGLVPQNEPFASLLALTERGYADSDERCLTKTPGVFVAGDCREKRIRQVTTAAADGAVAALAACDYLDAQK